MYSGGHRQVWNWYIQYTYIVGELFRPVSQRVQMNFIFNDNVRILCLSCNVKKVGKLVRFKMYVHVYIVYLYGEMQQKSWIKDQTVRYNFNETESSLSKSDFDDFGQIVPREDFKTWNWPERIWSSISFLLLDWNDSNPGQFEIWVYTLQKIKKK
jgi:hypothetical protein